MEGSNLQAMVLGPSPGTCFLQYTVEESLLMHVLPVVALVLPQHKLLRATLLCFSLALESLLARTCPPQVPPNPFNEPPFLGFSPAQALWMSPWVFLRLRPLWLYNVLSCPRRKAHDHTRSQIWFPSFATWSLVLVLRVTVLLSRDRHKLILKTFGRS